MLQPADLKRPSLTPQDAQTLWGISPGTFNSYRMREQLPGTVVKAGKLHYTKFTVIQMCQLGVQLELVKQFRFSQADAKILAAEAAIGIEQAFLSHVRPFPNLPYAIVQSDPPRWFRVHLDDSLLSVDQRAGGVPWVLYDPTEIVQKVCDFLVDASGQRADCEKWVKLQKAKKN